MSLPPVVTVCIPCRNEEGYLGPCLDSIIATDYPKDRLEVFVVDGLSTDRTRALAQEYAGAHPWIRVLDNPKRILAAGWNTGIRAGSGSVVVSMNAHATVEPDFLSKCVRYLESSGAGCVGPAITTHAQTDTVFGQAIAAMMSHPFGVGNSRFRIGAREPMWVDTVHVGAFRREAFEALGGYNEELVRSQDIELHLRHRRAGGRILMVPEIRAHYYTRTNPRGFLQYGFLNGFWVTYPYKFGAIVAAARHLVPLAFVLGLAASLAAWGRWPALGWFPAAILGAYFALAFGFGAREALKRRDWRFSFLMPVAFFTYHFTYGVGSLVGLLRSLASPRFWGLLRRSPGGPTAQE